MVGTVNSELWNSGSEENKEICRARKRKLNYICNVLVIKDQENPENEGKVLLFKFGKKIFDKIVAAAKPDEDLGEDPINVFDPEEGADFLLRQIIVGGFPNYDQSKFSSKKSIAGGKKRIDEVLSQCRDLNLEVAPEKFKSEEELAKKFLWVTGGEAQKTAHKNYDDELDELTKIASAPAAVPAKPKKAPPVVTEVDSEDDAAFFASLVNE
jgi:hypothetical protein